MSFRKNEYIMTDIDFEDDEGDDIEDNLNGSNPDEVLSQYSNSDLQEFNDFERDIYGGIEDASSEDQMNSHILPEEGHESADEVSDSLRLVLPNIMVRPSLGNPIETYDQLRGQYQQNFQQESTVTTSNINGFSNSNQHGKNRSEQSRISSRASVASEETVRSQNEEHGNSSKVLIAPPSKPFVKVSSVSSNDSLAHHSTHKSHNKATQKILLDKEREVRKDQDKYISHLQHTINQLLTKHALAEETIDQLRLGVVINTQTRLRDQKPQRRPPSSVKKKTSRRYSSIIDNAAFQQFDDKPNVLSRAKSVDMSMFEEEPNSRRYDQEYLANDFGGSMKQISNSISKETEIANDIRTIGDYFQSRIKILNEVANNLQYNSSGRASVSSGSHNSDNLKGSNKTIYDNQRDTPLKNRLKNLQNAFEDLQSDFNGFRQINKDSAKEYSGQKDEGLNNVEGDLFELGMKIDDLEHILTEGRLTPTNKEVFERDNELITRFSNVEEQYQNLMDRYNDLKGSRSPTRQRLLDNVVQQLQNLVKEANGRYSNIPTPDKLDFMMQRDIIDKIKQHMSSDSPPYFLTEEDGLSSGNSSFGRGHRRRKGYRLPRSDEDSDFKIQNAERLSPIKSRISINLPDDHVDSFKSSQHQVGKAGSLPVSIVSSSSIWQGATSGETLALDDQGILRDSVSRKGNSSAGSENFLFPNKNADVIEGSRRLSKGSNVFNGRIKTESYLINGSPLLDDIKRLDEQLEKVELEEKRQLSAARESDAAGSRNTRSLLGTSPSNSVLSRHSKQANSVASSHRSQGTSSDQRRYSHNDPIKERKKRKSKSKYNLHPSLSDSDDETPSEDYNVIDYVKSSGCGLGPRSRYVRSKNSNLTDRWSQTPPDFHRRHPNHRSYDRTYSGELEDPYIDDVAYWDGVAFHPSRESIPGKSILRRSPSNGQHRIKKGIRPRSLYVPQEKDYFPRPIQHSRYPIKKSSSYYPESNVSREYYKMDPYRYFVREYGQRMGQYEPPVFEEESDYDDSSPYENYLEERRLRDYLDEAVQAAQSMKRYTKRISDLCEQRKYDQNNGSLFPQRNYNDFYSQHS